MKAIKCVFVLLVAIGAVAGCWAMEKVAASEEMDKQIVVEGNNEFALELYAKLRSGEGNLFLSPYSISTALAMAYAGARGETETEMAKVLHFPTVPSETVAVKDTFAPKQFHSAFGTIVKDLNTRGRKGGYELTVANALWGQKGYGFLEEFLELIKTSYGGNLNEVDFVRAAETARKTINIWVGKRPTTRLKISLARVC